MEVINFKQIIWRIKIIIIWTFKYPNIARISVMLFTFLIMTHKAACLCMLQEYDISRKQKMFWIFFLNLSKIQNLPFIIHLRHICLISSEAWFNIGASDRWRRPILGLQVFPFCNIIPIVFWDMQILIILHIIQKNVISEHDFISKLPVFVSGMDEKCNSLRGGFFC